MSERARGIASVEEIRRHFPALARVHAGLPVAYFDGPGGTQVPKQVSDAVSGYLLHHNANTHWAYPTSRETDAALLSARAALADYVNGRPDEIVFGANMTTLTFHLARALGRKWGAGDEIIVTELDHHANVDTWRSLERERGVTIRVVRMQPGTGQLELADFDAQLSPRTRLVAVGAASNALGTINDVAWVARRAHDCGALVFVDAVHYAAHLPPDVQALACDFLACSAYKFYGPHVGVLWGRKELLETLDVPKLQPASESAPERLETGTLCHEGIVGAGAAVDFLASLAASDGTRRSRLEVVGEELHVRGQALLQRLWEGLRSIPGVTVYGVPPAGRRTPTVSFVLAGRPARQVAEALAERAVFASDGDFYATTVAARLGHSEDGLVRAGCAAYTTPEEIERLIEGVRSLA
jgi:cysteine desulfurase family protein (TIGR01976 family)